MDMNTKEVLLDHRLMIQTLPQELRRKLSVYLPGNTFQSVWNFDATTSALVWNEPQLHHLNWLLQDLHLFFNWKPGSKRTKDKTFNSDEAQALISQLRHTIFESVATVHHVEGVPEAQAVMIKFPPTLIDNLFPVYSKKELIYLKESLKKKVALRGQKTEAAKLMFPTEAKDRPQWVKDGAHKVTQEEIETTAFESKTMATAYYSSTTSSALMQIGHDEPIIQYNGCLTEVFMQFIWACGNLNCYNMFDDKEIAYRFYYLASQSQWKSDEDGSNFTLPSTYEDCVQLPHVDYSHARNTRVKEQEINDLWSMDLPLTKEGCTILVWPSKGSGVPIHMKHGEMLLRSANLIHSGGIPGRFNGDAFRLHGAVGVEKYRAEMNGPPQTFKEDADNVKYHTHHLFPDADVVVKAVMDRY